MANLLGVTDDIGQSEQHGDGTAEERKEADQDGVLPQDVEVVVEAENLPQGCHHHQHLRPHPHFSSRPICLSMLDLMYMYQPIIVSCYHL